MILRLYYSSHVRWSISSKSILLQAVCGTLSKGSRARFLVLGPPRGLPFKNCRMHALLTMYVPHSRMCSPSGGYTAGSTLKDFRSLQNKQKNMRGDAAIYGTLPPRRTRFLKRGHRLLLYWCIEGHQHHMLQTRMTHTFPGIVYCFSLFMHGLQASGH